MANPRRKNGKFINTPAQTHHWRNLMARLYASLDLPTNHGWQDRGEETDEWRTVFNLDSIARMWRSNREDFAWSGEVLVHGQWSPFEADGDLDYITGRLRGIASGEIPFNGELITNKPREYNLYGLEASG